MLPNTKYCVGESNLLGSLLVSPALLLTVYFFAAWTVDFLRRLRLSKRNITMTMIITTTIGATIDTARYVVYCGDRVGEGVGE